MNTTIASQQLPDEAAIYPYSALAGLPARSLLVFAPHPDDEVFGCGGTLARAIDAQMPVHVVVVSGGGAGGDVAVRERETMAAALEWGSSTHLPTIDFWRQTDRAVHADAGFVARIAALIEARGADMVLAPSPLEVHPDHRVVSLAVTQAFMQLMPRGPSCQLAYYEVGHPLLPNVLVDITPVLARKRRAMAAFASQLTSQRYDEHVLALNRYRSYTLGPQVTHTEAFHLIDAETAARGVPALIDSMHQHLLRRLGLAPIHPI